MHTTKRAVAFVGFMCVVLDARGETNYFPPGVCGAAERAGIAFLLPPGVQTMCVHQATPTAARYLYVGGTFNLAGSNASHNFARYNLESKAWDSRLSTNHANVGPEFSLNYVAGHQNVSNQAIGAVLSLVCPPNQPFLYLGGYFSTVGSSIRDDYHGQQAWGFARFDAKIFNEAGSSDHSAWGFIWGGDQPPDDICHGLDPPCSQVGFHGPSKSTANVAGISAMGCTEVGRCDVLYVTGLFDNVGVKNGLSGFAKLNLTGWAPGVPYFDITGRVTKLGIGSAATITGQSANAVLGIDYLGNGTQGLVKSLAVLSDDAIIFGGFYLAGGGDASAPMLTQWSRTLGFHCAKSALAEVKGAVAKSCSTPGLCCASLAGPVETLTALSRTTSDSHPLSTYMQVVFAGGQFEVFDPGAIGVTPLIAGSKVAPISQNLAALNIANGLQPVGSSGLLQGNIGWGTNGAVKASHCANWTAAYLVLGSSSTLPSALRNGAELCTVLYVGGEFDTLFQLQATVTSESALSGITKANPVNMPLGLMRFVVSWKYKPGTVTTRESLQALFSASSPVHTAGSNPACRTAKNSVSAIVDVKSGSTNDDVFFGGAASCYGSVGKISVPKSVRGAPAPQPVAFATVPPEAPIHRCDEVQANPVLYTAPDQSGVSFCCARGYYCPVQGVAIACPQGWGYFCNGTDVGVCEEGFFCPASGVRTKCPSGYYCPQGSTEPLSCRLYLINWCRHKGHKKPASAAGVSFSISLVMFFMMLYSFKVSTWLRLKLRRRRDDRRTNDSSQRTRRVHSIQRSGRNSRSPTRISNPLANSNSDSDTECADQEKEGVAAAAEIEMVNTSSPSNTTNASNLDDALMGSNPAYSDSNDTDSGAHDVQSKLVDTTIVDRAHGAGSLYATRAIRAGTVEADLKYCCSSFPVDIAFRNLSVTLHNGKKILAGVTGRMRPGRITAVMGPSGCGKTTLMSALSDRIRGGGTVGGDVRINDRVMPISTVQPYVGFVPQEDTMIRNLTVKENLRYYAMLRRETRGHFALSRAQTSNMVNACIHAMGLWHVRHSVIGDVKVRGISGGQRKRVNVAIELMGRPSLLFLDEPTSGLDATSTNELIANLKRLASYKLNVVMVIHQPRYEVFQKIDDVLLLGVGGHSAFVGETKHALAYFKSKIGMEPGEGVNPADFFIDVISENPRRGGKDVLEIWRDHADRADAASPFTHDSHNMGQLASVISESVRSVPKRKPPLMVQQILIFAHRYLAQQHAERYSFYFDMWLLSGIAILVGIAVPSTTTQFQLSNLIIGLTATLSALRIFGPEYSVFCREAFTNTSTAAYFLGKILAYLPRLAFMPFIYTLNFQAAAWPGIPFVKLYEIFLAAQLTCTALGMFISLVVDEKSSQVCSVIIILFSALFNGIQPTVNTLKSFPWGVGILDVSFSYWTINALTVASLRTHKPAILQEAIIRTNEIGYTSINSTRFQAANGSVPVVAYELLEINVQQRILGQLYLFSAFATLSLLVAIYASASASNKLHKTQMLYGCLRCVPDFMLKPMVFCFDGVVRLCFDDRTHHSRRDAQFPAAAQGSEGDLSNGENGDPTRSSRLDVSSISTTPESLSQSVNHPIRSASLDASASTGSQTRNYPANSVVTRMTASRSQY